MPAAASSTAIPRLRAIFLEGGCGWLPWYLARMNHYYPVAEFFRSSFGLGKITSKSRPETYKDRIYVTAEADETAAAPSFSAILGDDKIMVSEDMPHLEEREGSGEDLGERTDITEVQKEKNPLDRNAEKFYKHQGQAEEARGLPPPPSRGRSCRERDGRTGRVRHRRRQRHGPGDGADCWPPPARRVAIADRNEDGARQTASAIESRPAGKDRFRSDELDVADPTAVNDRAVAAAAGRAGDRSMPLVNIAGFYQVVGSPGHHRCGLGGACLPSTSTGTFHTSAARRCPT